MRKSSRALRRGGGLALACLVLCLVAPTASVASDAALFYEALAPHGKWVIYADLGPVWFPAGVTAEWRPYVDGRWVPTPWGWVFETAEPWGWATYHFGHWLPTLDFGWVWLPGRTWYPATVVWRSSRDYIGWAPMPPPFFTPAPAFGGGAFLIGGDPFARLTPFFWTLCPVREFLRGVGTFWAPGHSFLRCGCLVPLHGVAAILPQTALLTNFFVLGPRPQGCFAFGPDFHLLSQTVAVPVSELERVAGTVSPAQVQQLLPPPALLEKHPYLKEAAPTELLQGQALAVAPVPDPQGAAADFLKTDAAPRLTRLPVLPADLPRAVTVPFATRTGPEALKGVKGADLPAAAINPRLAPPPAPIKSPPPQAEERPAEVTTSPRPAPPLPREETPAPREAPLTGREGVALRGPAPEAGRETEVPRRPRLMEVPRTGVSPAPLGEEAPPTGPSAPGVTPRGRTPVPAPPPALAPPPMGREPGPQAVSPPARRQAGQVLQEQRLREQWERQLRRALERERRAAPPAAPPAVRERQKPPRVPPQTPPEEPGRRPQPPGGGPQGWPPRPGAGR